MLVHQAEILGHIKLVDCHTASTAEIWHLDHHHIWKPLTVEIKISLLSVPHLPHQHRASHCTLLAHSVPSGGKATVQNVPEQNFQQISKTKHCWNTKQSPKQSTQDPLLPLKQCIVCAMHTETKCGVQDSTKLAVCSRSIMMTWTSTSKPLYLHML